MFRSRPTVRFHQKFTSDEDALLRDIVENKRASTWAEAVAFFPGRNARQLRDRWSNYVNPAIAATPWTAEEDALLEEKYAALGAQWRFIAGYFPNRSRAQLKYQWLAKHKPAPTAQPPQSLPEITIPRDPDFLAPSGGLFPFQLEDDRLWAEFRSKDK
jgi:hypothetical protein